MFILYAPDSPYDITVRNMLSTHEQVCALPHSDAQQQQQSGGKSSASTPNPSRNAPAAFPPASAAAASALSRLPVSSNRDPSDHSDDMAVFDVTSLPPCRSPDIDALVHHFFPGLNEQHRLDEGGSGHEVDRSGSPDTAAMVHHYFPGLHEQHGPAEGGFGDEVARSSSPDTAAMVHHFFPDLDGG